MTVVRAPRLQTPAAPTAGFRRTMHVAVGPDRPYRADDGVPRRVHAGVRDLVDGAVAASCALRAEVTADDHVAQLTVDDAPLDEFVGAPAVRGFRHRVARAGADLDRPHAGVLLDLPVGVALAGYARMQAGRQAGRSTAEVIDAAALPVLADSCAGWARDGEVMRRVRDGGYRPPRLPPEVEDADVGAWHDLGRLRPWWVRRRRRVDVVRRGDALHVDAAFRDSWMDGEGVERSLHEWEVDLSLAGDGTVLAIAGFPRSLPFGVCPQVAPRLERLVGSPVAQLRDTVRDHLGGVAGCTHLNDLLGVVPAAVAAAGH